MSRNVSNHNESYGQGVLNFMHLNNVSVFQWLLHMSIVSPAIFFSSLSISFFPFKLYKKCVRGYNKDVENTSWLSQNQFIIFKLPIVPKITLNMTVSSAVIHTTNILIINKGCCCSFVWRYMVSSSCYILNLDTAGVHPPTRNKDSWTLHNGDIE